MAIDFPNSPSVNDTYVADERTWKWDGTTWRLLSGIASLTTIDINNSAEIGAAIADADDFPIYDVSASVNRKTDASRIPTYVFSKTSGDVTFNSSGVGSIASGAIVDADVSASAAIDKTKISGTAITAADTGTVTSTMIADGTIVNADVNSSAAIALSKLASGTSAQVIVANSSGVPTYTTLSGDVTISNTGVTTIAANSVALGTDTTGNYVADVVAGTGVTVTHTPGEGSSASIAIGQAVSTTSEVTFSGVKSTSVIEPLTISATAATGTVAIDAANGTTYYTTNATANWVVNLRWNSSTTLDSKLSTGEMTTTSFLARQGTTAYYVTSVQVNGTTSGVTTRWQGGTAPTSGNASSTDMYTFTVVKTGSATFDVFAAQTRFA